MTSTTDRLLRLLAVVALALAPLASHAEPSSAGALVVAARKALARGDGIDAEVKLRTAMQRGAPRPAVAADLGEAYLLQGDRDRAEQWLAPRQFSPDTAVQGYRRLARLRDMQGRFAEAEAVFDAALAMTPNDAGLWVEIGRLRYRSGQHVAAIEAADHALALDKRNVRALEFKGELVRDRYGLLAAVPWFETAIVQAPNDVSVLLQYAATLGDAGRATQMLIVTRRVLELAPGNARAYYLQAVMAARAGNYELARGLLSRTGGALDREPGVLLLRGVVELAAGNADTASDVLEKLLAARPDDARARELLARALFLSGDYRALTTRFAAAIGRDEASPYLLTLVARGFEQVGDRQQAGVLLDRAAAPPAATLRVLAGTSEIGALLAQGRAGEALAGAERSRAAMPGNYDAQSLAGDAQLAAGHAAAAQERYALAAQIRMSDSLLLRRYQAFLSAGDRQGARDMVRAWAIENPASRTALSLEARLAFDGGDPRTAAAILDFLRSTGGARDVRLLSDLAVLQTLAGDAEEGAANATTAYRLQRTSPVAAQALGLGYATVGGQPDRARALLAKARQVLGDNPVLAEAERRLR